VKLWPRSSVSVVAIPTAGHSSCRNSDCLNKVLYPIYIILNILGGSLPLHCVLTHHYFLDGRQIKKKNDQQYAPFISATNVECSIIVQEFLANTANDSRRSSQKVPLAPATKGLKDLMQKLGGLNARHEALVRRVDELEVAIHRCLGLKSITLKVRHLPYGIITLLSYLVPDTSLVVTAARPGGMKS